ncbi:VENN motif pre-toxin domain-containing protein, partial [Enterobacteriaceae bacterium LUAb1]
KAITAATAAIQGLAGGNTGAALSGAAGPYLAEVVKKLTTDEEGHVNKTANLMGHAVVNAVLALAADKDALSGAAGGATGEAAGLIAGQVYGRQPEALTEQEKQAVSALATLAAGLAGGLAGNSSADVLAAAQAGKTTVESNYLSSKQTDAWSAEMKSCQAGGGDCGSIIKKYEELSTAQQKQLISDCAANPAVCQQTYGDVLSDSLAVKQAIDRALGEDIPVKMVYDLTATFAQQMQAEGVVATSKVSEALQKEYGLDEVQAGIVASAAASAFGGISKVGKGSAIPVPNPVKASNGITYQSNSKHTLGGVGNRPNAGIEPKNSLSLFENSIPLNIKGKEHKARYTIDNNGDIHRFSPDNTGGYHWSGSTADKKNKLELPNDVRAALRKQEGWKIK